MLNKNYISSQNPRKGGLAGYFILQFKTEVEPILPELRYASIHGDANDYNVLVRNGRVAGFIDFGDLDLVCTHQ